MAPLGALTGLVALQRHERAVPGYHTSILPHRSGPQQHAGVACQAGVLQTHARVAESPTHASDRHVRCRGDMVTTCAPSPAPPHHALITGASQSCCATPEASAHSALSSADAESGRERRCNQPLAIVKRWAGNVDRVALNVSVVVRRKPTATTAAAGRSALVTEGVTEAEPRGQPDAEINHNRFHVVYVLAYNSRRLLVLRHVAPLGPLRAPATQEGRPATGGQPKFQAVQAQNFRVLPSLHEALSWRDASSSFTLPTTLHLACTIRDASCAAQCAPSSMARRQRAEVTGLTERALETNSASREHSSPANARTTELQTLQRWQLARPANGGAWPHCSLAGLELLIQMPVACMVCDRRLAYKHDRRR